MRNRKNVVVVHLTEMELNSLNQKVKQSGLRRETFLRKVISGQEVKPQPSESYQDLAREVSAIGNNINQIAHQANAVRTVSPQQISQVQMYLNQLWVLLKEQL